MTDTAPAETVSTSERQLVGTEFPAAGPGGPIEHVALVTIDRREALNALSFDLLDELAATLERLDRDPACRAIVLTGAGTRAFAAGADIRELAAQTPVSLTVEDRFASWDRIAAIGTPLIAAVRGFALGGGCELAMICDMIVAAEDAQFGQPEIKLGVMPGAGGTQRLTRAIGKAKAMELILTGRTMTAAEAEASGLVTKRRPGRRRRSTRRSSWPPASPPSRRSRSGPPSRRSCGRTSSRSRPGSSSSGAHSSCSSRARTRPRAWRPSPTNDRRDWTGR